MNRLLGKFPTLIKVALLLLPLMATMVSAQQPTLPMPGQPSQQFAPLATIDASGQSFIATMDASYLSFQATSDVFRATLNAPFPSFTTQQTRSGAPTLQSFASAIGNALFTLIAAGIGSVLIYFVLAAFVGFQAMLKFTVRIVAFILLISGMFAFGVSLFMLLAALSAFSQTSNRDEYIRAAASITALTALAWSAGLFSSALVSMLLGAGGLLIVSTYNQVNETGEDVSRLSQAVRQRSQQRTNIAPVAPPSAYMRPPGI